MKKYSLDSPAAITAICTLVAVTFLTYKSFGATITPILSIFVSIVVYILSKKMFVPLRDKSLIPEQLICRCWSKLWPICIILFFLVPSWKQFVPRSFEIRNFPVGQEHQITEQQINIYGVYFNGQRVLSPRQLLKHSDKSGNWTLQKNHITGQGASILQWRGNLPYSAIGVLSLRVGFGPEAGTVQIIRDGVPLIASLHYPKSGGNLTYQFSSKILSSYFIIDCLFRLLLATVLYYLLVVIVVIISRNAIEPSKEQLQSIHRINGFLVILLFLFTLVACWPGDMRGDSMFSYCWARDNLLKDGRSIPYILIWQALFLFTYEPWPMLLIHLVTYWTGWYLLAETMRPKIGYLSLIPIVIGALPWTMGLSGTLLEQMLIANILLITTVLLLRTFQKKDLSGSRFLLLIFLLFCAYCIRDKTDGLYVFPLLYICVDRFSIISIWRNKLLHKLAVSIIIFVLFVFSSTMLKTYLQVEKVHKEKVMLSHFHAMAVNKYGQVNNNENFNIYFNQRSTWRIGQPYHSDYLNRIQRSSTTAVLYLSGIIHKNFSNFTENYLVNLKNTLLINKNQGSIRWDRFPEAKHVNCYNLQKPESGLSKALTRYVNSNRNIVFFKPWFMLVMALAILGYIYRMRGRYLLYEGEYKLLLAVNVSSLIAIMLYVPLAFVSFFHYYYWASLGNWFCISYIFIGSVYNCSQKISIFNHSHN